MAEKKEPLRTVANAYGVLNETIRCTVCALHKKQETEQTGSTLG